MASRGTWRQNLQLCVLFSCWERAGEGTGCRWFPCVPWLLCGALLFPHGGSTMAPSCPLPSPPALPGHPLGAHVCPKSSALTNPDPAHAGALRVELSRSPPPPSCASRSSPRLRSVCGAGRGALGASSLPSAGLGHGACPVATGPSACQRRLWARDRSCSDAGSSRRRTGRIRPVPLLLESRLPRGRLLTLQLRLTRRAILI